MKQNNNEADQFSLVKNQCKNHTNAISDAGYTKFIQDYILSIYSHKAIEIDFSREIEAILASGEIVKLGPESILKNLYRNNGLN